MACLPHGIITRGAPAKSRTSSTIFRVLGDCLNGSVFRLSPLFSPNFPFRNDLSASDFSAYSYRQLKPNWPISYFVSSEISWGSPESTVPRWYLSLIYARGPEDSNPSITFLILFTSLERWPACSKLAFHILRRHGIGLAGLLLLSP